MKKRCAALGLAAGWVCAQAFSPSAQAGLLDGIGAMGDSLPDEYQFYSADPGDRSFARGFVEILAELRGLNFGEFTTADRGSPRHQGYAHNWARTRTTAASEFLLAPGVDFTPILSLEQHTGLAGQVAAKQVTLTWLFVGENDFLGLFLAPGTVPDLAEMIGSMVLNVSTAVGTIMAADPDVKLVLATIPDIGRLPAAEAFAATLPPPEAEAIRAAITAATLAYNAQLAAIAASDDAVGDRIILADVHGMVEAVFSQPAFVFGGIEIDRFAPGTGLHHLFLADGIHPGTIASGIVANLFIDRINAEFGAGIQPLSEDEIVAFARSVPDPSVLGALGMALIGLGGGRRLRRAH